MTNILGGSMSLRIKEPINALTHFIGVILSIIGTIVLLVIAVEEATVWHVVSFAIFGASMILLYTASTLYHALAVSERAIQVLHRIDHMMIFILIAGTYTPICLVPLRGVWGWTIFGIIWGLALLGILLKFIWFNAPRWLSTLFYVAMGWVAIIAFIPIIKAIPLGGVIWLVAGGVFYTIGAVIYALKKPDIFKKYLGFHEIFHIFVLLGTLCHFILMFSYIMYL